MKIDFKWRRLASFLVWAIHFFIFGSKTLLEGM